MMGPVKCGVLWMLLIAQTVFCVKLRRRITDSERFLQLFKQHKQNLHQTVVGNDPGDTGVFLTRIFSNCRGRDAKLLQFMECVHVMGKDPGKDKHKGKDEGEDKVFNDVVGTRL